MPTYQADERFWREWRRLPREHRAAFRRARDRFVAGLESGSLDPSLRVKRIQSTRKVWELTWAGDGRATFEYGSEQRPGQTHVIWRRIGTHDILKEP